MNIKTFLVGLVIGAIIMFTLKQCNTEIIEKPVTIEVEVPVEKKVFDTVYEPTPVPYKVTEVDTTLVEKYKKANDSLKKALFEEAVKVNEYKEVFEDSIQTITVGANVTGKLNSLSVDYETKPRKIKVDTVIPFKTPSTKNSFSLYVEGGVPSRQGADTNFVLKGGIDFSNKKYVYGISYDSQGRIWGKVGLKL